MNVASAIKNTVSISLFNRGQAGQIFADVKKNGAKVVMKHNEPECVLLSPSEYIRLIEEAEEAILIKETLKRLENYDPAKTLSQEEVYRDLGISEEDLIGWEDIQFE